MYTANLSSFRRLEGRPLPSYQLLHQTLRERERERERAGKKGMAFQIHAILSHCSSSLPRIKKSAKENVAALPTLRNISSRQTIRSVVRSSTDSSSSSGRWGEFLKQIPTPIPCLSDVLWPSAGAFAAMALLGRLDQFVAHKGVSFTIAPIGAVCAVLFAAPSSPAAQKYNMFVAQIGCAAIGVLALSIFGPGWLARATALAASIAFMTVTGSVHPPAASLPILFIDGAKFHHLSLWYALFPGATGCLLICLIQEMVTFFKRNYRF